MAKSVWRFLIAIEDSQDVPMPKDAEILSAQFQHGQLCLWALVTPRTGNRSRRIYIYGTGHDIPEGTLKYIGTVQQMDCALAWHIFEEIPQ